jgi:hypothetical protein
MNYLRDRKGMKLTEPKQLSYPVGFNPEDRSVMFDRGKVGRCFEFLASEWAGDDAVGFEDLGKKAEFETVGQSRQSQMENVHKSGFQDEF